MDDKAKLQLDAEDMRAFGYRVIDMLVEHFETVRDKPATRGLSNADRDEIREMPLPAAGMPWYAALDEFERLGLRSINHVDHPRFFAYIPLTNNFAGIMADALASGFNIFSAVYAQGQGAAEIELAAVEWLRQICGLPAGAGGLFVSGGSVANLSALAVARQIHLDGKMDDAIVYCSDQTHFAVSRGLRVLGFQREQLRVIQSDEDFRLPLPALRGAIADDREAGKRPFCIAATAGTTSSGAVDPLDALADLCQEEGLWLHVDGAYGAPARLSQRGKVALRGMERADSIALDAHKWLFQPIECGCVLVRKREWLGETFMERGDYLVTADDDINFGDMGIQLTRSFRALKVWLSLKVFGADAMRQAIERGFELAEMAEAALREVGIWEIVTPAQMAIVTFRYRPAAGGDELANAVTSGLMGALADDGFAFASGSTLGGKQVLRLCANNPRTTAADIQATVALLGRLARKLEEDNRRKTNPPSKVSS